MHKGHRFVLRDVDISLADYNSVTTLKYEIKSYGRLKISPDFQWKVKVGESG